MLYEVRFTSNREGAPTEGHAYEPRTGDGFAVSKREAMRRYNDLLSFGRESIHVDGAVPWCVEIVGEDGALMLHATTTADDEPTGKWARLN